MVGQTRRTEMLPEKVAHRAMEVIHQHRRGATQTCPQQGICEDCIRPGIQKLRDQVEMGQPLQIMILAFPCKSPNLSKVLGALPDMAELLSLKFMHEWTEKISKFYGPGAEIVIGADGRAFADLVEVSDELINAYMAELKRLIHEFNLSIRYVGIDELRPDLAAAKDYNGLRDTLSINMAARIEQLRVKARSDPNFTYQVNGIERFLMEDFANPSHASKSQLRKKARERAYMIIQRGNELRIMLERQFPHAARCSIHPQTTHDNKLGVHIFPTRSEWMTPWHSVAVKQGESFSLMKRSDAEALGGQVVLINGRPSYYSVS